jgi:hypothetical protein
MMVKVTDGDVSTCVILDLRDKVLNDVIRSGRLSKSSIIQVTAYKLIILFDKKYVRSRTPNSVVNVCSLFLCASYSHPIFL